MKIKNKIMVVIFLLISCITTICFASNNINENVENLRKVDNVNTIKSEITDTLSKTDIKKENIYNFKNYNFLCGLKINPSRINGSISLFGAIGNKAKEMLHI